jgi:zinc transport system substrate-binding protein
MKIIFNKEVFALYQKKWVMVLLLAVLTFSLSGCRAAEQEPISHNVITVSIVPQKYFVERLAGDHFSVNVLVAPGQSPENYEPTHSQMRAISASAAYLQIGAQFEDVWIEKIRSSNPDMVIFDSSSGIERIPMQEHSHEEEGASAEQHTDEELDPHIWTSPALVKIQSQNITNLLIQIDPANEQDYRANLAAFLGDIDQLDQELQAEFKDLTNRKFMVYHPAWGYFARDYGLEQIAIEVGGTEPSAREMSQIIDLAKSEEIKVIFVQPEFSTRSAQAIADEIGGSVVPISPLEYDWLENLRSIGKILSGTLAK